MEPPSCKRFTPVLFLGLGIYMTRPGTESDSNADVSIIGRPMPICLQSFRCAGPCTRMAMVQSEASSPGVYSRAQGKLAV